MHLGNVNQTAAGNKTFTGNLTVGGNLTVNGSTSTLNTTNSVVKDKLIELGNGTAGSPSGDAGLVIERGSSSNAFMGWDESADQFLMGTGSFTGSSTGNLTVSKGTLNANIIGDVTGTLTGNATGSSGSCTGNSATATKLAAARTISGVSVDGTSNITLNNANITNGAGYVTANTQLTNEQVQDIVGAMVDGGTETNISVTYNDASGKLNFVSTDTNTTYSVGDGGLTQKNFTTTLFNKLNGIAAGATNTAAPYYTSAIAIGDGGLTQKNF